MNENKLKELYEEEINNSAPDFDKLWAKIDSRLTEKTTEIKITPKKNNVKVIVTVAACLALVAFIPSLFSSGRITFDSATAPAENPSENAAAEEQADDAPPADYEIMANPAYDDFVPSWQPKSYDELSFDSYSETVYTCTGKPYGNDYFVEDVILAETDCFAVAMVKDVSLSNDGSSIIYTLEAQCSYGVDGKGVNDIFSVESRSVHTMKRGRKYLLPLVKTDNGYRTAYDNVPQIEFTSDGAMVYYNGWTSLNGRYSNIISYPQKTVDDFFYDRMMLSGGGYSELIEKFYEIKEL